jgi:DNA-binding NarL/FixJ family response regulator
MSSIGDTPRVTLAGPANLVEALTLGLTAAGVEVVAACTDRAEVIAAVRRRATDVVIVDRNLHGGGLIAAAAVAARRRRPKVLVVGGDAPGERRAARLAGASAYLPRSSAATAIAALVAELAGKDRH